MNNQVRSGISIHNIGTSCILNRKFFRVRSMSLTTVDLGENLSEFAHFCLLLPTFHYLFRKFIEVAKRIFNNLQERMVSDTRLTTQAAGSLIIE